MASLAKVEVCCNPTDHQAVLDNWAEGWGSGRNAAERVRFAPCGVEHPCVTDQERPCGQIDYRELSRVVLMLSRLEQSDDRSCTSG